MKKKSVLVILYAGVLVMWSVYRATTNFSEGIDELVAKPLLWLVPMVFVLRWEKRRFTKLGFKKITIRAVSLAILTGISLALLQIIPNILKGSAVTHVPAHLGWLFLSTMGTAFCEEVFFRGFFLQALQRYFSSTVAVILTALLFLGMHIPLFVFVNHMSGVSLFLGLEMVFVSGICFGLLTISTKNLWAAIIAHYVLDAILLIF